MSEADIILHTCNNTEIPPNPNKNAVIIMFIPSEKEAIELTKFTPEVNSIIPEINGIIKLGSIFNNKNAGCKILKNKLKICNLLKIEMITLNSTTNPLIRNIE